MSFKLTRNTEVQSLTATVTPQTVDMVSSYTKVAIAVPNNATPTGIRVSINGSPATIDGNTGVIIASGDCLALYDHTVRSIKYVRDTGASGDVMFSIIGMW